VRDRPQLGDQELAVLRFVGDRQPVSLREVADEFGEPNNLARTTVHTMLERLRKKRFLARSKKSGVFLYKLAGEQEDVMNRLVESFVERTLGGSVGAFVAYLAQSKRLQPDEVEALGKLVDDMRSAEATLEEGENER
jgi:predicted transcriptional regulator